MYAQLVDDEKRITIVQVGSLGKEFVARAAGLENKSKCAISKLVGEMLAEKAKEKGVTTVVFDRKGYLYHGRVKVLADAARSKGLVF
jgi:large subunit ribosomal protein L18